jgi:hypothetical protein
VSEEEKNFEGRRGRVAGSRKAADGDNREASGRRRKRKGRRMIGEMTAPAILGCGASCRKSDVCRVVSTARWCCEVVLMPKVMHMNCSLLFSDDDDDDDHSLTPSPTMQPRTGNSAYLPDEDDDKDKDEHKGVELGRGKPVVWCGQNGKCIDA